MRILGGFSMSGGPQIIVSRFGISSKYAKEITCQRGRIPLVSGHFHLREEAMAQRAPWGRFMLQVSLRGAWVWGRPPKYQANCVAEGLSGFIAWKEVEFLRVGCYCLGYRQSLGGLLITSS